MPNSGTVETNIESGIAFITFAHPKSNSLPQNLLNKLADSIKNAGIHPYIKVIVLASKGEKAFCAGASFDELAALTDAEAATKFFKGFANVLNAIRKCPKLVVARIQGKAVGGGVGIAAAADYALAFNLASIKLSELDLGIGPFVVGPAVERKIGVSNFAAMSIDTEWRTAEWAAKAGLYTNIFDSIENLDEAVFKLAYKLSNSSPHAMKELKKSLWHGTENWDEILADRANISGCLAISDFTKNYIEVFLKK